MLNRATWLETTPIGFKVRVQFIPTNEAEHKKIQDLLLNPDVSVVMATTQGPLSVDLMFTPNVVPDQKPAAVVAAQPAQAPAPILESKPSLVDSIKAKIGMAKPDASGKVQ